MGFYNIRKGRNANDLKHKTMQAIQAKKNYASKMNNLYNQNKMNLYDTRQEKKKRKKKGPSI